MKKQLIIGNTTSQFSNAQVKGETVKIAGENYYKIANVNQMRPFFMSIVSSSNHWMFLSSNGGLTAGRKNSENALFPYYTDDKITEFAEFTGSKTLIKIIKLEQQYLWEPFSDRYEGVYNITRNLYKNSYGNKVIFEEVNPDLGLIYKYEWNTSEKYGFVKKSTLINTTQQQIEVEILDGLQNILPHGVGDQLQLNTSNLVDAYKKNELENGVGIFALSAIIVDKAEPSEALKSTTVWSLGLQHPIYLLSSLQVADFRSGKSVTEEIDIRAEKGAYFVNSKLNITAGGESNWLFVADINQSAVAVEQTIYNLKNQQDLAQKIQNDIEQGTKQLKALTASADGIQLTADKLVNTRHFANTLFNCMRGGIFDNNYEITKSDFSKYLFNANKQLWRHKQDIVNSLPDVFSLLHLQTLTENDTDSDFKRLCIEYLPLTFSRRHGDPSRPWNKFSINTQSEIDGSKILDYEGNWRDIFQNWEALAHAYPEFIDGMIHRFLNATTFDGYNPYRVTKDGFDWETIEPDNPWSYIGYWGDHQIIYLLKFLEFIEKYYPNKLASYFTQNLFVYANVPYVIKPYADLLENPKDTIIFNADLDRDIRENRTVIGADGALLKNRKGAVVKANLMEKLLATVLAKIANFIPEAGIWMNTQRPEWNDANNALVGNGVSMVTLYYLYRFLNFFKAVLSQTNVDVYEVSAELVLFFHKIKDGLNSNSSLLKGTISDEDRKAVMDILGGAGSDFRTAIYGSSFTGEKTEITRAEILNFTQITLQYLEHTIDANKRADKLYHSYNLIDFNSNRASVSYLPEMLEGQVAVLSSGYVTGVSALELLDALKQSKLFRADQYSYILYPNKQLPRFLAKNNILASDIEQSELVRKLLKAGNTQIVERDIEGVYHFNGAFNNANSLKQELDKLPEVYQKLVEKEINLLLNIFEKVFNHKAFTGRSGTFFGYEGLGSIYWHMVSKLLLSVQEVCLQAIANCDDSELIGKLLDHYYEIEAGIGVHKSPDLYGAFPTDPYSHTPGGKGAQQPGMTGQVKEDILTRFGELGVFVTDGKLQFNPCLLQTTEFLNYPEIFSYYDIHKNEQQIKVDKGCIGFTYCQILIVYKLGSKQAIEVIYNDKTKQCFDTLVLDRATSSKVFKRTGEVERITVFFKQ